MPSQGDWPQIPEDLLLSMRPHGGRQLSFKDLSIQPEVTPKAHFWAASGHELSFQSMRQGIAESLRSAGLIHRGKWQTLDVANSGAHATHELRNVILCYTVPGFSVQQLNRDIQPDQPWADEHHLERVGGEALNPAPSYVRWPHHAGSADRHVEDAVFSHTYPERFWPRFAGKSPDYMGPGHVGIRYSYGDLSGVIGQLVRNPGTRQAVLPVWFPEDTGATDRRVPCSLSYHFMSDEANILSVWYTIRACDFVRHFHNDIYFASRLLQWVCIQVTQRTQGETQLVPGDVHMTISSLHVFQGDVHRLP